MTLVDSSVWVDYFNGALTPETDALDTLLGTAPLAIGDVILVEVLQGFRKDADFRSADSLLGHLTCFDMLGANMAIQTANNYRWLRKKGITVRKTIDAVIATFCIQNQLPLLYSDRDFDPFVKYLGLKVPKLSGRV